MDIGINYLSELDKTQNRYDELYKILIKRGYINTLKFPGKYCDYNSLDHFLKIVSETGAKIDIHGLPGMIPAIHSKNLTQNIKWDKILYQLVNCKRISTHMGLENKETMKNYEDGTFEANIRKLKEKLNCEVGIENIPGGFEFDKLTLTPEFITKTWENADFGVFDISHAKLAATDLDMTYKDYLERIGYKEKVKILHVSGNKGFTNKYLNKPDKHVLISEEEISDVIQLLDQFKNIDLIISEYAYNEKYSYEKEIVIETIVLSTIIKTRNEKEAIKKLKYLEKELNDNLSNMEDVIHKGDV